MKIGKLVITKEITPSPKHITALSDFVNTQVVVLEKIAAQDGKETFVVIIGTCLKFKDIDDTAKVIPTYQLEFIPTILGKEAGDLLCRVK